MKLNQIYKALHEAQEVELPDNIRSNYDIDVEFIASNKCDEDVYIISVESDDTRDFSKFRKGFAGFDKVGRVKFVEDYFKKVLGDLKKVAKLDAKVFDGNIYGAEVDPKAAAKTFEDENEKVYVVGIDGAEIYKITIQCKLAK